MKLKQQELSSDILLVVMGRSLEVHTVKTNRKCKGSQGKLFWLWQQTDSQLHHGQV